eukprot:m.180295 g.180295  ORF g.180295 m.180295 type:complete len:573 (-) comp25414_c0_seq1:633-2351(-)
MDIKWEDARDFLVSAGVIAANQVPPTLVDFAAVLQNGEALCHLANRLRPNAVPHVHRRPARQFLCFQNINGFLMACSQSFGLSQDSIFSAEELFHASQFQKVIQTISKLSKTSISQQLGLRPFPSASSSKPLSPEEEDIYGTLENVIEKKNIRQNVTGRARSSQNKVSFDCSSVDDDSDSDDDLLEYEDYSAVFPIEESVYDDLCAVKKKLKNLKQTSKSSSEKLKYIFQELCETETNYVEALRIINQCFRTPLEQHGSSVGLSSQDLKQIFLNVAALHQTHSRFLKKLDKIENVSPAFLEFRNEFLMYASYCARVPDSIKRLEELCGKKEIASALKNLKETSSQRFELKDLLSVPMQRMLKYPLLLRDLIDHTDSSSQRGSLTMALKAIQDIAKFINETKRDHDNLLLMGQLQASLREYPLGQPGVLPLHEYGKYLMDGDLKIRMENDGKTAKRYVFLFQKALLVCKQKGAHYHYLYSMNTRDFSVEDEWQKGRNIAIKMKSTLPSAIMFNCTFICKSEQLKTEWMEAVLQAKSDVWPEVLKQQDRMGITFQSALSMSQSTAMCVNSCSGG